MLFKSFSGVDPITLFFFLFFFGVKLGHFIINYFCYMLQTRKLTREKRKNSLLAKKKSFIGSASGKYKPKFLIKNVQSNLNSKVIFVVKLVKTLLKFKIEYKLVHNLFSRLLNICIIIYLNLLSKEGLI